MVSVLNGVRVLEVAQFALAPSAAAILSDWGADVFITNYLPSARAKLGIDVEDIRAANPDIVYGRGSAHGPRGGEADLGGFESIYWLRTGAASAATGAGGELVTIPAPGFGDGQTGLAFAGGLAAALFHRERTGEALVVDVSLLSSGIWAMQAGWSAPT